MWNFWCYIFPEVWNKFSFLCLSINANEHHFQAEQHSVLIILSTGGSWKDDPSWSFCSLKNLPLVFHLGSQENIPMAKQYEGNSHKLAASSWPFSRLLLKRASPTWAGWRGRVCVQSTFHGLPAVQKEITLVWCWCMNYGRLSGLAMLGLSTLQMLMTSHSTEDFAHSIANTAL